MSELGRILTEEHNPQVKALVVYNSNPAAIAPDQHTVRRGLGRDDLFTVVLEQFQTDTADFADIVLPVTTFLEHTDLYYAYGHYHLQLARPALEAPGEALPNTEIFRRLASLLHFDDPCFRDTDDAMIRTLLDTRHPFLDGITIEQLDREHSVRLKIGDPFLPFANGGFGTPSGKCEFRAETLGYEPPVESRLGNPDLIARFPLEMISPKNDDSMNSTFGLRPDTDSQTSNALKLHPDRCDPAKNRDRRCRASVQRSRAMHIARRGVRHHCGRCCIRPFRPLAEAFARWQLGKYADLPAPDRQRRGRHVL